MAEVRDVLLRIRGETRGAEDSLSNLEKKSSTLASSIKTVGVASAAAFGTMAATAAAVSKAADVADLGDQYLDLRNSFEAASVAANKVSKTFLQDLRNATDNAVSDADLMKGTMRGLTLELEKSGVSIVDVAETVKDFADATGRDFPASYDQFIGALATGRTMTLQTMGINIDAKKVVEEYAAAHGKAVKDLSELEKGQAKQLAAVEELKKQTDNLTGGLEAMGLGSRNAGDAAQTMKAQIENAKNEMLAGFASSESLKDGFDDMTGSMEDVPWEELGQGMGRLVSQVIHAANGVVFAGQAIGNFAADMHDLIAPTRLARAEVLAATEDIAKIADTVEAQELHIERLKEQFVGAKDAFLELAAAEGTNSKATQRAMGRMLGYEQALKRAEARLNGVTIATSKAGDALGEFGDDNDEAGKHAKELAKEIDKLNRSLSDIHRNDAISNLKEQLKEAAGAADSTTFEKVEKELAESITGGVIEGLDKSKNDPEALRIAREIGRAQAEIYAEEVVEKEREERNKAAKEIADKQRDEMKRAYGESVDFFEDILIGAVEGNISDVLENMLIRAAIKFGAEMLAQMTGAFSADALFGGGTGSGLDFSSLFGGTGSATGELGATTGGSGGGLGAFGGLGVAIGAYALSTQGSNIYGQLTDGDVSNTDLQQTALTVTSPNYSFQSGANSALGEPVDQKYIDAGYTYQGVQAAAATQGSGLATSGAQAAGTSYLSMFGPYGQAAAAFIAYSGVDLNDYIGSGKEPEQRYREAVVGNLQEQGLVDDDYQFDTFGGKFDLGDNVQPDGTFLGEFDGPQEYEDLGSIIGGMGGSDGSGGTNEMFANMLESTGSLNAAILTVVSSIESMGLSVEEYGEALTQAMLDGEISVESYNEQMRGLELLNMDSLGSIEEGWELLAATIGGKPRDSVKAMELLYQEFAEAGIQDTDAMVAHVREKFGDEAAEIFRSLAEHGIDQFTDFSELSQSQVGLLVNSFNLLVPSLEGVGEATNDAATEVERGTDRMVRSVRRVGDEALSTQEKLDRLAVD